jgi:ankyrin repeat protein
VPPLHWAAELEDPSVAELLLAAETGRAPVATLLLTRGAEVDARSRSGATPLHRSARYGRLDVARLLLEHGADLAARTSDGRTPLGEALFWDRVELAELLRARGGVE